MKLIKTHIFLVIILLAISNIVNAQNVNDIITKHLKAHGDTKKWDTIESMKISGIFTAFSIEKDFFAIKTNAGAYYSELHLGKYKVIESFNGKTGWTIDPWQEFDFPRELNNTEINVFYQKSDFFSPFYKYKEKGYLVELLGQQKIDGKDVIAINLTRSNNLVETWYLDAKTYLEYKCESMWTDFAYQNPAETYFDDFRNIDGLIIPFYIERTFGQRNRMMQIETIEFNIKIDESKFEMPRSKEINKLAFLEGEWDVKVDVMTRRGSWYNVDNTVSSINFEATNMLREKLKYERILVQSLITNYTYNSSTDKYRLTVFNGFSSNINIYEGSFNDSTFIAENTNISYGDSVPVNTYSQITIGTIESDSFIIEKKRSTDNGNTWNPRDKFTYTRKIE